MFYWMKPLPEADNYLLKQLAPDKYDKKVSDYCEIVRRGDYLFDVRLNAYYTGTLMRFLKDEIGDGEVLSIKGIGSKWI